MTKYVVKRVLLAILTVFIVCAITFFAMNAIPGGPFDGEKAISDEVRRVLEQRFNLDKPVWEQFFLYLNNLLHGDFGVSAKTGREIKTTIFSSFSVSAKLGGMAVLVALISGVVMGSIAALTRNKLPDRLIIFFSTLFTSLPSFVLGTLLLLVFCIKLKWVPVWSSSSHNYVLPVIALAAYPWPTSPTDQDEYAGCSGTGLCPYRAGEGRCTVEGHLQAYPEKALIPVITYVGPMTASILTGSLVVESIFTIGGLGSKFVECITNRDYPMIMGTTIFLATLMVTMTLITDIVYKLIDPRITLE